MFRTVPLSIVWSFSLYTQQSSHNFKILLVQKIIFFKYLFFGHFVALGFLTPECAVPLVPCSYVSGHREGRTLRMSTNLHLCLHHETYRHVKKTGKIYIVYRVVNFLKSYLSKHRSKFQVSVRK